MRHRLTLAAVLIGVTQALPVWPQAGAGTYPLEAQARKVVESYCEADFRALPIRDSVTTYSSAVKRAHQEDWGWPLIDWMWDPLTVVAAYRIRDVTANDSTGSATIEFDELALSPGHGRFVGLPRRMSRVTLTLKRSRGEWRVFDPPEPRVSRNALVETYAEQLAQCDESWFKEASVPQVVGYQRIVEGLKFLKGL